MGLHPLRHLNTKQAHARLDDFRHSLAEGKADSTLLRVFLLQDLEVVIEAVELLRQVIAIVGDDADVVVGASLTNGSSKGGKLLDEGDLLLA